MGVRLHCVEQWLINVREASKLRPNTSIGYIVSAVPIHIAPHVSALEVTARLDSCVCVCHWWQHIKIFIYDCSIHSLIRIYKEYHSAPQYGIYMDYHTLCCIWTLSKHCIGLPRRLHVSYIGQSKTCNKVNATPMIRNWGFYGAIPRVLKSNSVKYFTLILMDGQIHVFDKQLTSLVFMPVLSYTLTWGLRFVFIHLL